MGVMEIVLIILGMIVFVGSFLIPAGKKSEPQESDSHMSQEMIREMVVQEMEDAKLQIGDIVDETITYAMEKTERSMERLTNEKMLAVNEYSDTVLEEINRNHKEVVFLYDMLNDKHENLKTTVSEAVKTASEVKQTVKDAEIFAKEVEAETMDGGGEMPAPAVEFKPIMPEKVEPVYRAPEVKAVQEPVVAETPVQPERKRMMKLQMPSMLLEQEDVMPEEMETEPEGEDPKDVDVMLDAEAKRNSNERILELHKAGKSNMTIAKELGLGIGEVKLVIDLFEGL